MKILPLVHRLKRYLITLPVILTAVLVAHLMQPYFDRTNVVMVYMLAVVVVAFRLGTGPAVMGCLLSVLLYDFINVPPYFSLGAEAYEYAFTLIVMLITAGIISTLAGRLKQKAAESKDREARTSALYSLSADLAGSQTEQEILESTVRHLSRAFHAEVKVFHSEGMEGDSLLPFRFPTVDTSVRGKSMPIFVREVDNNVEATAPVVVESGIRFFIYAACSARWLGAAEQREYLSAMVGQCAQALERNNLRERVHEKEILIQKESLRNSILSTISHDLRTPLASIIGASSSLLADGDSFSAESRQRLRSIIHAEASHMLHMVENLLDLAKLQGGDIRLSRELEALEEIVGSAVASIRRRAETHVLLVEVPHDLPFVPCDSVLMERVLINLLENAIKYSPAGTTIRLSAIHESEHIVVTVEDQGEGIPVSQRQKVFDPFYRLHNSVAGGGLGLTICRRIIEAHHGAIWIDDDTEVGTAVRFTLPVVASALDARVANASTHEV